MQSLSSASPQWTFNSCAFVNELLRWSWIECGFFGGSQGFYCLASRACKVGNATRFQAKKVLCCGKMRNWAYAEKQPETALATTIKKISVNEGLRLLHGSLPSRTDWTSWYFRIVRRPSFFGKTKEGAWKFNPVVTATATRIVGLVVCYGMQSHRYLAICLWHIFLKKPADSLFSVSSILAHSENCCLCWISWPLSCAWNSGQTLHEPIRLIFPASSHFELLIGFPWKTQNNAWHAWLLKLWLELSRGWKKSWKHDGKTFAETHSESF